MAGMHRKDIGGKLAQEPISRGFGRGMLATLTNKYLLIAVVGIVLFAFSCTVTRGPGSETYGSCLNASASLIPEWDQKRGFPMTAFNEHYVCGYVIQLADGLSNASWKVSPVGLLGNVVSAVAVASLIVMAADRIKRKKYNHGRH